LGKHPCLSNYPIVLPLLEQRINGKRWLSDLTQERGKCNFSPPNDPDSFAG
jgi:hypothetical protein